jgi:hypothetical protein
MRANLDRFRAAVLAGGALQQRLAETQDGERFVARAVEAAAAAGIALDPSELGELAKPDPLGLARFVPAPCGGRAWPGRQWLPAELVMDAGGPALDWLHFAGAPLAEPFFAESVRTATARPFNRLCRYRMPLDALLDPPPADAAAMPDGFIFHMTRCGSTLVSQMLAALPDHAVLSEPPPLDTLIALLGPEPGAGGIAALRALVGALGRDRGGVTRRRFVKLYGWHALALPMLRRAFPEVPWMFLHRDPVEVLASHAHHPGFQFDPATVPAARFGLAEPAPEAFAAAVMAAGCRAALAAADQGGLIVAYRDLPDAMFSRVLPHFGVAPGAGERATMAAVAQRNAKAPHLSFAPDGERKRAVADERVRALAREHLAEPCAKLDALGARVQP